MIIVSLIVTALPFVKLLGQRSIASVKVQFVASGKDEFSLTAALVGVVMITRGYYLADPIASIVVATVIAVAGALLFKKNSAMLLGQAPKREFLARVEAVPRSVTSVIGLEPRRLEKTFVKNGKLRQVSTRYLYDTSSFLRFEFVFSGCKVILIGI